MSYEEQTIESSTTTAVSGTTPRRSFIDRLKQIGRRAVSPSTAVVSAEPPIVAQSETIAPSPLPVATPPSLPPQPTFVPAEPLTLGPPKRDRIVIIGRRMSGKTTYLASLYAHLWRSPVGLTARALSGEVHQHLMDAYAVLQSGQWPAATIAVSRLEMELEYHKSKHLLVALDFAGEVFARAFLHEQVDTPEAKALVDHIDRAAAVILLVDPSVGAGPDHRAAMEEDFGFVQAIQRVLNWPGGDRVPIVLVLTKMDQHQNVVNGFGGVKEIIQHHFPALVRLLKQITIFQVSAVQIVTRDDGKTYPAPNSVPVNLENPLKFCLRKINENQQELAAQTIERQRTLIAMEQKRIQQTRERRQNILLFGIFIPLAVLIGAAVVIYILYFRGLK